jgi:hypothetical protein
MARSTFGTIVIRSNNPDNMQQRTRTAPAAAAVTPGMLLKLNTDGTTQAHGTADGAALSRMIATENFWSNHGSGLAIDHPYATGETVHYIHALPGDQLNLLLTTSQTIVIGDPLVSNGDGFLKKATISASTLEDAVVGYAAAAVTTTGATARILTNMA